MTYHGFYRAFVADNADPEKVGRVTLRIPQLYGNDVHDYWAYPLGFSSGDGFGDFTPPQKGAMVWACFENGDPRFPLWIGGHHGRNGAPSEALDDYPSAWVRKSPTGAKLVFDHDGASYLLNKEGNGVFLERDTVSIGVGGTGAEPLLMGDKAVTQLQNLCDQLSALCDGLAALTVNVAGVQSTPPVNAAQFVAVKVQVEAIKQGLLQIKSQITRTD